MKELCTEIFQNKFWCVLFTIIRILCRTNVDGELETQREVIMSMLLRHIGHPVVVNTITNILNWIKVCSYMCYMQCFLGGIFPVQIFIFLKSADPDSGKNADPVAPKKAKSWRFNIFLHICSMHIFSKDYLKEHFWDFGVYHVTIMQVGTCGWRNFDLW